MQLLLDTNIVIFWLNADKRVSQDLIDIISNSKHSCYISAASIWEIEIKASLGKLKIPDHYTDEISKQSFVELPISFIHAENVKALPDYHKDPFDRLIISQAIIERLTIVTLDRIFAKYPVDVLGLD